MFLKNIKLQNFRNYSNLEFEFKKNKTLFTGKNAQGKTNLLEAVYYLSSLESSRISRDIELIKFSEENAKITANLIKDEIETELEVFINPPKNKIIKVNGLKKNKHKDFVRFLKVVNFSSSDLMLLRGEPAFRRKWLDLAIAQVYPQYTDKLAKFNKIRLQKANYLANFGIDISMLDVFNRQLAIASSNIVFLRMKYLKQIIDNAKEKHFDISKSEKLAGFYESSVIDELIPVEEMTKRFFLALEENRQKEILKQSCLIGAHRDDIRFEINQKDARKFASQGQQRTLVLALKLAELDIIEAKTKSVPLLLLDDVLAELDDARQNFLLKSIKPDVQTIITCADTFSFDKNFLKNVDIVNISNGKLSF